MHIILPFIKKSMSFAEYIPISVFSTSHLDFHTFPEYHIIYTRYFAGYITGHKPAGQTVNWLLPARKEGKNMKIAVTYENGEVFQHFGHTEYFKIYEIQDKEITSSQIIDTNGSGHGALAGLLSSLQVDTLICGGIGMGAQAALLEAGIKLYGGASGSADRAVESLLAGNFTANPNFSCDHHGHHDHHGENHCSENKHGCAGNGGCN